MPVIDSTGLRALAEVARQSRAEGMQVVVCDLAPAVRQAIAGSPAAGLFEPAGLGLDFDGAVAVVGPTAEHRAVAG